MWLINTASLLLESVENSDQCRYAILSHTWADGEVDFKEMADLERAGAKPGFSKIEHTCQLARDRGIKFAWVDTCCIDKSSSAELTEAINSMFRWYNDAVVCFTFLSDLPSGDGSIMDNYFHRCRWFTRGWTLQELVASKDIEFYDQAWQLKGNKLSLQQPLCKVTGINVEVLENSDLISSIPVARRMSWAAMRRTSRVEDIAYCLFGIFDVNLPLIYGEGSKAFIRLQEAIALENNDLSLFAWTSQSEDDALRGIFARSPFEFRGCRTLQRIMDHSLPAAEFTMTNRGLRMVTRLSEGFEDYLLDLQCVNSSIGMRRNIFIRLLQTAHGHVRCRSNRLMVGSNATGRPSSVSIVYIPKVVTQSFGVKIMNTTGFSCIFSSSPEHLWSTLTSSFVTDGRDTFTAIVKVTISSSRLGTGDRVSYGFGSTYVIVLGLESRRDMIDTTDTGKSRMLKPWAAIYEQDDRKISTILSQEGDHGISQVLSQIRASVLTNTSDDRSLPTNILYKPTWAGWDRINNIALTSKPELTPVKLHVSVNIEENSDIMYELTLKVDRLYNYLPGSGIKM